MWAYAAVLRVNAILSAAACVDAECMLGHIRGRGVIVLWRSLLHTVYALHMPRSGHWDFVHLLCLCQGGNPGNDGKIAYKGEAVAFCCGQ